MNSSLILAVVAGYFLVLLLIAWATGRGAGNSDFFSGRRSSRWYVVAYGMIGTSLSGVTFMSVPGGVQAGHFYYMQIVLGYFIGYMLVAFVLLPLYYRLHLTSIYSYLGERFGRYSYATGASFFLLSRTLGACARIYLVLQVLQVFILDKWQVPFSVTTAVILLMILLYTYQGGVKTIVWTDTLQTTFMILALIATIVYIAHSMSFSLPALGSRIAASGYTQVFNTDWQSPAFFIKQILSGAFVTVAMTGLDQEMMQKNISCRSLGESQKNMVVFSITLVFVNLLFLVLGASLYLYAGAHLISLPAKPDAVFPTIALLYLPPLIGLIFIIGLVSALFPSADGAMTALTSSFCIDILGLDKNGDNEKAETRTRKMVHLCVAVIFLLTIMLFRWIDTGSIITLIIRVAGYTYGPLAALYALGLYSRIRPRERLVPLVCIAAPIITYIIEYMVNAHAAHMPGAYQMGFETAFVNVAITMLGLWMIKEKQPRTSISQD